MIDSDETDGKTRITVERKIQRTFLGPAASPATRELDDLMASLSETKVGFKVISFRFSTNLWHTLASLTLRRSWETSQPIALLRKIFCYLLRSGRALLVSLNNGVFLLCYPDIITKFRAWPEIANHILYLNLYVHALTIKTLLS